MSRQPSSLVARQGFTLIEIMVSIMIFVVVSGAMVGILMMGAELFRRGEFSRSANDETVAVLGSLEDDLNRMMPGAADGFVFSRVTATNGNCLFAFNERTANPESITSRGYRARSLVAFWVEQQGGVDKPECLRRIALDDQHDVLDVVNALHAADGRVAMRTRIATGVRWLHVDALDDQGITGGSILSVGPAVSGNWEWEWIPRRVIRRHLVHRSVASHAGGWRAVRDPCRKCAPLDALQHHRRRRSPLGGRSPAPAAPPRCRDRSNRDRVRGQRDGATDRCRRVAIANDGGASRRAA